MEIGIQEQQGWKQCHQRNPSRPGATEQSQQKKDSVHNRNWDEEQPKKRRQRKMHRVNNQGKVGQQQRTCRHQGYQSEAYTDQEEASH
jgi:hypothetical protein